MERRFPLPISPRLPTLVLGALLVCLSFAVPASAQGISASFSNMRCEVNGNFIVYTFTLRIDGALGRNVFVGLWPEDVATKKSVVFAGPPLFQPYRDQDGDIYVGQWVTPNFDPIFWQDFQLVLPVSVFPAGQYEAYPHVAVIGNSQIYNDAKFTGCTIRFGGDTTLNPGSQTGSTPVGNTVRLDCNRLSGEGRYSNPIVIGQITQPTIVTDCPPLITGNVVRYFLFALARTGSADAAAGAMFTPVPGAEASVHPRLVSSGGVTLLTSSQNGQWIGDPNGFGQVIRYLPLAGVAADTYRLGVEKLRVATSSMQTPTFSIILVP